MIFVGVDPGAAGGVAVISSDDSAGVHPLGDKTDRDVLDLFRDIAASPARLRKPAGVYAVLEKVGGYVSGKATPGSAMFNFGVGVGKLKMALAAAAIPYDEVTPQRWQKALGIPPREKSEGGTAWKNRLRACAERLFPGLKITLAVSDALLIAEFARRSRGTAGGGRTRP